MYVEELIGPETVNTMPLETIEAFQDHGEVRGDTVLEGDRRGASSCSCELATAGVDYDDVVETLEAEGVQKFADSFDEIIEEHRGPSAATLAARMTERRASSSSGSGRATRRSGRAPTRRSWLGWLDEPCAHARGRRPAAAFADVGRR